ncbi:MAG: transglutaminaseTgpA domain-containing protein [Actinomycetota bacterium]
MTAAEHPRDVRWVWLAAEIMLVLTSIAGIQLLQRLYEDGAFFNPMLFSVIVGHVVLVATRWFGFATVVSAISSFIAVVLAIVATHYSSSAIAVVVPTGQTVDQVQVDFEVARDVFNTLQTPVPTLIGFIVAGSLIFWVLTFAADWAAFRLLAPGQALLPMLTVLIFVSILGVETDRVATTAMLIVTGVLFLLAHRAASRAAQGIWLDEGPVRGYRALMTAGVIVAAVSVFAGVLGGPNVPGADEAPLVELGDEGRRETEPIEVISPLVQIQPRLVEQSDRILFTVDTNERAYWRIAALDVFDGSLWRSQGQYSNTDDGLDVAYDASGVPIVSIDATFDLGPLNVVWAPSAYLPVGVETISGGADLNYEAESATFIVDTSERTVSDGLRYRVRSAEPDFSADLLRSLPATSNDTIDDRYLQLPDNYSPLARSEAERITAPHATTYDKALALQNFFRDNFTYDIEVAKGHDIRRLEDFLTVQRGYCEQFAGTFASMARAVGIPARVVTGFTPGNQDPANPNRYFVSGKHAHAWPEVWIAGAGWVGFEPTPGRGAPNASDYTGVPESQASSDPLAPAPAPTAGAVPEAAEEVPGAAPTPTPVPFEPEPIPVTPEAAEPEAELLAEPEPGPNLIPLLIIGAIAALVAAWYFGIPALKRWRAQRRFALVGDDTRRRITLIWSDVVDLLERVGHPPEGNETLVEYADRLEFDYPVCTPAFGELTALTVAAAYGPAAPPQADADRAQTLADALLASIAETQTWIERSAYDVDPRPLMRFEDRIGRRADRLAAGATLTAAVATATPGAAIIDDAEVTPIDDRLVDPS